MKYIFEILLTGLAILITASVLPGMRVSGYLTAIVAGMLLSLVNITIGLVLRILTLPLNFLTLGLSSFIISVFMVLLVSDMLDGFYVKGFFNAALFAFVLAIFKMMFHKLQQED